MKKYDTLLNVVTRGEVVFISENQFYNALNNGEIYVNGEQQTKNITLPKPYYILFTEGPHHGLTFISECAAKKRFDNAMKITNHIKEKMKKNDLVMVDSHGNYTNHWDIDITDEKIAFGSRSVMLFDMGSDEGIYDTTETWFSQTFKDVHYIKIESLNASEFGLKVKGDELEITTN